MKKVLFMIAILSLGLSGLSACNTVEGFGEDVEHTGRTIQDAF